MTINTSDVKLLKSQRLNDESDGGGRATGQAVVDGLSNELFRDVSRMDRTLGDVSLRKAYAGVVAQNADPYLGAHAIVTKAPADPNVSVLLFNTGSQTDERAAVRNRIESYLVAATAAQFDLLGNQQIGQRALACVQLESRRQPEPGEVFQLVFGNDSQYVRVISVEARIETYIYDFGNGNFKEFPLRRLDLGISAPLNVTFPGGEPYPTGTIGTKSLVRATQVADAARYYGISPLAAAISQGDLSVRVRSVYAQLVPSATRETPLIDQLGGYRNRVVLASGPARAIALQFGAVTASQSRTYLSTACVPGSVQLTAGGGVYEDDARGGFRFVSGSNVFSTLEINYETGQIDVYRTTGAFVGAASGVYTPGAPLTGQAVTGEIEIELGNRGFAYTLNLADAKPRPGSLIVSYMALGKWQELRDAGNGELVGEGTGTIAFATGGVSLTLAALPDVSSSIIYQYLTQADNGVTQHTGSAAAGSRAVVRHQLPHDGILPGSFTATYTSGGTARVVTDQGNGQLGGAGGSGVIYYPSGELVMELSASPDVGTSIAYAYEQGTVNDGSITLGADGGGVVSGTLPGAPLKPGSVRVEWAVTQRQAAPAAYRNGTEAPIYESQITKTRSAVDDGSGAWADGFAGSINYTTGAFTLKVRGDYVFKQYSYIRHPTVANAKPELRATDTTLQEGFGGTLQVRSQSAGLVYGGQTDSQPAPPVTFDLLPSITDPIVPGSLILQWGGQVYVDRDGVLFRGVSTQTNAGTAVGSVDYAGRRATLTTYPAGAPPAITVLACLTSNAGFDINSVTFRTPGAPLRPGSLQITAVRADNAQVVTAVADLAGNIDTPVIKGRVDATTGICRLQFTSNPNDVTGTSDIPVIPALLRYNTVLYTTLPLDATLIGLDPVRLPADGRVPIYREGEVLVIHHTAETNIGSPSAGQVVTLARDHQADIEVVDANGVALDPAAFTANRELGRVTFADPLALNDVEGSPLVPPLRVRDRVEHMTVCNEVQISGALGINSPVPWDLPAGETLVSSAVVWGDLQARLYRWFTQQTWSTSAPNWSDTPTAGGTTAQYDQLNYPPIVTNFGSIAGRWALVFTGSSSFQVVEQQLGIIAVGSTGSDCAPINPATGTPYFVIRAAGWGSGWSAGNAVRFNTDACLGPLWICRTVLAGQGTVQDDTFKLQVRGDAD